MARANILEGGFSYYGCRYAPNMAPNPIAKQVASAYGTAIFSGDPVKKVSDGTVAVAAAGDPIYGVVSGVRYLNADGKYVSKNYVPASISYTPDRQRTIVYVIQALPGVLFRCASNAAIASVATARTYEDENVDHVATNAGNTGTGRSGFQLDMSTHNTTSSQWRLVQLLCGEDDPTNDPTQTNHYWIVEANESHNFAGTFSTTGI